MLWWPSPSGMPVAVDLDKLVESIAISPGAPSWFADLVGKLLDKYERNWKVHQSDLDANPTFDACGRQTQGRTDKMSKPAHT